MPPIDPVPSTFPVYEKQDVVDGLAVPLSDVREFVGLPTVDASRDVELTIFVKAATAAIEQHCQMSILDTTWLASGPFFGERMRLAKRPFKAVTKVEYVQEVTGEITTVASSKYYTTPDGQRAGMIFLGDGLDWPEDVAVRHDAVRVTFLAGYGTDHIYVPPDIRHAILMTVAAMDAKRGDCEDSGSGASVYAMKNSTPSIVPASAQPLLAPYVYHHVAVA